MKQSVFDQAIAVAMSSDAPKKMGAILLDKRNRIIASGTNSYVRTHPVQYWAAQNAATIWRDQGLSQKVYLHSEIRVLISAKKKNANTIVVCRVGGHGGRKLRNARPCKICSTYLRNCSNVVHVYYSTPQGFMYEYWGENQ